MTITNLAECRDLFNNNRIATTIRKLKSTNIFALKE